MRKLIFILSFVAVMANASALSQITASGPRPKAGDVIRGVVKDSDGPVETVIIREKNNKNEVIDYTYSDKDGCFSFKLMDPADSIWIYMPGYYPVSSLILNNQYDVYIELDPNQYHPSKDIIYNRLSKAYHDLYPLMLLDGCTIPYDSVIWKDIDYTKDTYTEKEIAVLLGIPADTIESITVLRGEAATKDWWGLRGKNGVVYVRTKTHAESIGKGRGNSKRKSKGSR